MFNREIVDDTIGDLSVLSEQERLYIAIQLCLNISAERDENLLNLHDGAGNYHVVIASGHAAKWLSPAMNHLLRGSTTTHSVFTQKPPHPSLSQRIVKFFNRR